MKAKVKKISVPIVGTAVGVVIVWLLGTVGMPVMAEVAVAFGTIATAVVSWLVPDEMEAD